MASLPEKPPKILMVITDLNVGGVPLYLARLANWLVTQNFDVHAVSLAPLGPVARHFDETRITVSSCDARGSYDLRALFRLRKLIQACRPDLIQSFLFHANLAVRLLGPPAGVPSDRIVCEIQTVEIHRKWHLTLDRWTIGRCAFEIGNSPSVVDHLRSAGLPREKLLLILGGIDVEPYENADPLDRATLGIQDDDPILLWTGRLDPVKNLEMLIKAFEAVLQRQPAYLLLAGDGPLRPKLEAEIQSRGLRSRVMLLGTRDDVPALLKTANVFVFPSLTEGLPNAVLEALASGVPVVATDVPGNRDVIEHERTGLLAPPGNSGRFADSIVKLLNRTSLASDLAEAGAASIQARFRQADNFAAHRDRYLEILKKKTCIGL